MYATMISCLLEDQKHEMKRLQVSIELYSGETKLNNQTLFAFFTGTVIEGASSIGTTPDPLNTAFVNVNIFFQNISNKLIFLS